SNSSQDYGTFNPVEDNEFLADLFADVPDGDINLDGVVAGDGSGGDDDDVALFIANWKSEQTVNGIAVGDRISREQGDFNFDGSIDLADWHLLRINHPDGGSLDLATLLGTSVPEPSTILATIFATGVLVGRRGLRSAPRRRG
ncbi:MAG: PEP-CTERM sorting domain-containing protein, partial [Planctomycetota bacterium]